MEVGGDVDASFADDTSMGTAWDGVDPLLATVAPMAVASLVRGTCDDGTCDDGTAATDTLHRRGDAACKACNRRRIVDGVSTLVVSTALAISLLVADVLPVGSEASSIRPGGGRAVGNGIDELLGASATGTAAAAEQFSLSRSDFAGSSCPQ